MGIKIPESQERKDSNKDKAVHKIFVGRITENLTKEDIKDHFETFGTVTDVYIPVPFRHFCFVQFSEFKVAQSLLGKEHSIKGVTVKIGEAAPKGREDRGGQDRRYGLWWWLCLGRWCLPWTIPWRARPRLWSQPCCCLWWQRRGIWRWQQWIWRWQ